VPKSLIVSPSPVRRPQRKQPRKLKTQRERQPTQRVGLTRLPNQRRNRTRRATRKRTISPSGNDQLNPILLPQIQRIAHPPQLATHRRPVRGNNPPRDYKV